MPTGLGPPRHAAGLYPGANQNYELEAVRPWSIHVVRGTATSAPLTTTIVEGANGGADTLGFAPRVAGTPWRVIDMTEGSTPNDDAQSENADGSVDGTYEARVGDENVSMDTATPTVRDLLQEADKETEGVYLSTPDGEDFRNLDDEVDLSEPGRERFLVQTRTSGNST